LALEYARAFDAVIADHAEDASLTDGAQMHEGEVSAMLGLAGWPAPPVGWVRGAGARGGGGPPGAPPHPFTLTDEVARSYDPVFKVNPPLREKADVEAVRLGLADGTPHAITTHHPPPARE